MKRLDPELVDKLAAEYVLGTLRGKARARFERWRNADFSIQSRVRYWEAKLVPLAAEALRVEPTARVWREIEARISDHGVATSAVASSQTAGVTAKTLSFWRRLAISFGTLATALGIGLGLLATASDPHCYAVLSTQQSVPKLVVFDRRDMKELVVLPVGGSLAVNGTTPYLWIKAGEVAVLAGQLKPDDQTTVPLSPAALSALMKPNAKLIVTAEPAGSTPTVPGAAPMVEGMVAMLGAAPAK